MSLRDGCHVCRYDGTGVADGLFWVMNTKIDSEHEVFMRRCLGLAKEASDAGEVPVGALVVRQGEVIASARNAQIGSCDPTAHAEIIALRAASLALDNYRMPGCVLYTTVEPCLMCAGAALHARVDCVVYGAEEPRAGAASGRVNYFTEMAHVHKLTLVGGILEEDCRYLIQQFFKSRR